MEKTKSNRFTTIETEESIIVSLPPPGFNNPITVIFTTINILLLINLSAIVYGIYYANLVDKLGLTVFSLPWVGFGVIVNLVLVRQFTVGTLIEINSEEIKVLSSCKKKLKKRFYTEEIKKIKIIESTGKPDNMYPKLFIVTNVKEHDISRFIGFIFNNEEVVSLGNKIGKYIQKDVVG